MKQQGFAHVTLANLSATDDLHFPNFKVDWFQQQAIAFLDGAAAAQPDAAVAPAPLEAQPAPTSTAVPAPTPPPSPAAHLLSQAKLYLDNIQPRRRQSK